MVEGKGHETKTNYKSTLSFITIIGEFMKLNEDFNNQLTIGKIKNKTFYLNKIFSLKREYKLSYKEDGISEDPQYMDVQEIINYIQTNYLNHQEEKDKSKLINDLIIFQNYRDDLEGCIEIRKNIFNLWKYFITITATLVTLKDIFWKVDNSITRRRIPKTGGRDENSIIIEIFYRIKSFVFRIWNFIKNSQEIRTILIICILIAIFYKLAISYKNSSANRLKTVKQSIRVLENLKEHYY